MYAKVYGETTCGINGEQIIVEVDISNRLPFFWITRTTRSPWNTAASCSRSGCARLWCSGRARPTMRVRRTAALPQRVC